MAKQELDYRECLAETVQALGEGRVLLASKGKGGKPNAMAIGWGTIGLIWGKPIFLVFVRPSRYTYRLIEEGGEFTVNVLPASMREVVTYCGSVSGRDQDKLKEKGLTALASDKVSTPIIGEGIVHFECRVVHTNDVAPAALDEHIQANCYSGGDFHRLYFGEILSCRRDTSPQ